jgi:hypothetical protein
MENYNPLNYKIRFVTFVTDPEQRGPIIVLYRKSASGIAERLKDDNAEGVQRPLSTSCVNSHRGDRPECSLFSQLASLNRVWTSAELTLKELLGPYWATEVTLIDFGSVLPSPILPHVLAKSG